MADKVRLRVEVRAVLEYDALFRDYDTDDPAAIAKMDQESAEDDVYMFLDSEDTNWDIKVVPVDA